mmetsp:Transcript_82975/g.161572  ORF Transcript_82975/g.161572 Transcript_82975/m.161572 type:complete len:650 (-) Transcript_82975:175-2124(-)
MDDSDIGFQADMFQNEGIKAAGDEESKYDPKSPLTMTDVPGNYNNVAFRPLAKDGYQIPEFEACFQGAGLGGNGVYNGALFQEPANWWWDDDSTHTDIFVTPEQQEQGLKVSDILKPYYDRVQEVLKDAIKTTPSMDGIHYTHGLYDLVKPHLERANFNEIPYYPGNPEKQAGNAKLENAGNRFYTVPTVNAKEGLRTGASAWIEKFMDGDGKVRQEFDNLKVLTHTEVLKVNLGDDGEVKGVEVMENAKGSKRGGLKKPPGPIKTIFNVKKGGRVILSCNALPTNRILYKSGVGPEAVRTTVMPSSVDHFKVDNEAIGTTINEHVTTSLGFKFTGEDKPQPNKVHFGDSKDWVGQSEHLASYARDRSGPYAQFGPVVASHFVADLSRCKNLTTDYRQGLEDGKVTTELFYNPFGAGPYPPCNKPSLNPYNGEGTYTVYVMLLRPESRALFKLDKDDKPTYTTCYMNVGPGPSDTIREALHLPDYNEAAKRDIATMTASVHEVLEITHNADDIKTNLGPGDGNSKHLFINATTTIAELDETKIEDVLKYVTFFDDQSYVNGEYLAITHMEENHYHSAVPLARNLDVFGKQLGDRKDKYGLDPDTCEVKGTKGLCVVDAGMFPKVVYCHPIGSVMALAEWAADKISPPKE